MSRSPSSLSPDYFAERYARNGDPWGFATSDYENAKYRATVEALPKPRYVAGLEIGCSIGVLTRALAARCDVLLALDVAEAALDQARARCADLPHVSFARGCAPADWPDGDFDLIVLSEVVYYLHPSDVGRLADRARHSLRFDGSIVMVHWTGETDYPLSGDDAANLFIAQSVDFAAVVRQERTERYRLDVLTRA